MQLVCITFHKFLHFTYLMWVGQWVEAGGEWGLIVIGRVWVNFSEHGVWA